MFLLLLYVTYELLENKNKMNYVDNTNLALNGDGVDFLIMNSFIPSFSSKEYWYDPVPKIYHVKKNSQMILKKYLPKRDIDKSKIRIKNCRACGVEFHVSGRCRLDAIPEYCRRCKKSRWR